MTSIIQTDLNQKVIIKGKLIFRKKSEFQEIKVIKNKFYGIILNLDTDFQVSEKDEFFYHEPFCHSVMCLHKHPVNMLIIGGGDGCLLREILKYDIINKIDLVEIDGEVI